jgi:hypothetical protein
MERYEIAQCLMAKKNERRMGIPPVFAAMKKDEIMRYFSEI